VVRRAGALAAAVAAAGAAAACSLVTDSFRSNDFSGDSFPIRVELTSGAVVVGVRDGAPGVSDRAALLDVLSPLTVIDPGLGARDAITSGGLTILGADDSGALTVPRAQLRTTQIARIHPCAAEECAVGPPPGRPFQAIIGADALAGDALRLRLDPAAPRAFLIADVGGTDRDRTFVCDAVFPAPYRGGGTLVVAGTEVNFGGRRVTVGACLGGDPRAAPQGRRGADALLVVSTGVGATVLGEAAYLRYRQVRPTAPPLEALPAEELLLPSGPVIGRRATVDRVWLAAASSSAQRAPCRQIFAHELLTARDCEPLETDCPCADPDRFCPVPAVVDLRPPAGLAVLVVPDSSATLQALRAELRPDQPEVDGILGTGALALIELDIDYPRNRALVRCLPGAPCLARPAIDEANDRTQVRNCVRGPTEAQLTRPSW
jgi:hypothetical protein